MRAAIYVRISVEEQVRRGVSIDAQESTCRGYCARSGHGVEVVIRDEGASSRTPLLLRPSGRQLAELLAGDAALWRRVQRLGVEGVLAMAREGSVEGQLVFLRSVFERVDLLPVRRIVLHPRGLEPIERELTAYYSEARGVTDLGW